MPNSKSKQKRVRMQRKIGAKARAARQKEVIKKARTAARKG